MAVCRRSRWRRRRGPREEGAPKGAGLEAGVGARGGTAEGGPGSWPTSVRQGAPPKGATRGGATEGGPGSRGHRRRGPSSRPASVSEGAPSKEVARGGRARGWRRCARGRRQRGPSSRPMSMLAGGGGVWTKAAGAPLRRQPEAGGVATGLAGGRERAPESRGLGEPPGPACKGGPRVKEGEPSLRWAAPTGTAQGKAFSTKQVGWPSVVERKVRR